MSRRVRRPATPGVRPAFTLGEAVAALVIVGLGATAALESVASATRVEGRVDHALVAESLAEQRLATLRLLPRARLERLPDSLARGAFAPPLDRYHWQAAAALVPDLPDLFTVAVVVEWDGGSYTMETRHFNPRDNLRGR